MPDDITRRPYRSGNLFPEMVPLRAMMDRLLENALTPTNWAEGRLGEGGRLSGFGMDVEEDDDAYYVRCHLPGVRPEDVTIQFHDNVLTITGETRRDLPEGRRQVVREAHFGQFQRQVTLGAPVDADRAEATYEHGVLEIKLPKSEAVRPRTIPVRAAASSAAGATSGSSGSSGASSAGSAGSGSSSASATSQSADAPAAGKAAANAGATTGATPRSTSRTGSKQE